MIGSSQNVIIFGLLILPNILLEPLKSSPNGKVLPTLHNDIQDNDIQHNDIQHNDIQHNDTHHNDIHHNDTQHNDTQHND